LTIFHSKFSLKTGVNFFPTVFLVLPKFHIYSIQTFFLSYVIFFSGWHGPSFSHPLTRHKALLALCRGSGRRPTDPKASGHSEHKQSISFHRFDSSQIGLKSNSAIMIKVITITVITNSRL